MPDMRGDGEAGGSGCRVTLRVKLGLVYIGVKSIAAGNCHSMVREGGTESEGED